MKMSMRQHRRAPLALATMALLGCWGTGAGAQTTPPEAPTVVGLADIYIASRNRAPAVLAAEAGRDAVGHARRDAYIALAPRANWVFDYSRERQRVIRTANPVYQLGVGEFWNHGNTLEVVQPLFDSRLFAQLHGAHAGVTRGQAELELARQKMAFELIQSYLVALGSADAVTVARGEERALQQLSDEVGTKAQRGIVAQSDLDEVTARLGSARAQLTNAVAALNEAFATLERRAAGRVEAIAPLAAVIPMPLPSPADPDNWSNLAKERSPDVLVQEGVVQEARAAAELAGAALLPRVDLRFTANRLDSGGTLYGGGALTTDRTILFRVTVPVFNGDGNGYPVFAATSRYRSQQYRAEDLRLEAEERARIAYSEVASDARRSRELAQAVEAQQRVVVSRRQRYAAGVMRIVDVLNSERDLYTAQRALLSSRYNYLLNMMQLKRLVGDISDADIAFIDSELAKQAPPVRRISFGR
jgi:TolC family type I secretion outer membrane protein